MARTKEQVLSGLLGDVMRQWADSIVKVEELQDVVNTLQADAEKEKANSNGKK